MSVDIINIECNMYLETVSPRQFTIAVVDPPYGENCDSHRRNKSRGKIANSKDYHKALWDQPVPGDEFFNLLFRTTQQQAIFGGNYFKQLGEPFKTPRRHEINEWLQKYPYGWIAWDKCNGTTGFNDYELIWTSFTHMKSFVYKYMWNGFMQGLSIDRGHLQNPIKKNNEIRVHPAHKPVALYKFLYNRFDQWTFNILDTHLGGGSSALAAYQMGLDFTGLELDPEYYKIATKRFKEQTAQLILSYNQ